MNLRGHYQNAYLTHDLDHTLAAVDARYGKVDWIVFEPDMVLQAPDGPKHASVRAALGWHGGLQLEFIQPTKGWSLHYDPFLPADRSDPTPRFHHIAVRRENLADMRAEIAALGLPLAFEGEVPGVMVFIYLDARATLGHYLEYLWATPEGWAMQGWPEGRPVW
ncbi:MAG: VOC family protein [Sphingomonadales bacterium]|nr:VOC family protein [Sphingomonadales bacterium]